MGFDNQAECAAGTLSRSMDRAVTSTGTVSGWARNGAKATQDGVIVTPKNAATAALYTYTPWVGEAGGGREGVGGASLRFAVWDRFATAVGYGAWARPTETPRTSETDAAATADAGPEDEHAAPPPTSDERRGGRRCRADDRRGATERRLGGRRDPGRGQRASRVERATAEVELARTARPRRAARGHGRGARRQAEVDRRLRDDRRDRARRRCARRARRRGDPRGLPPPSLRYFVSAAAIVSASTLPRTARAPLRSQSTVPFAMPSYISR